jgi:flagellar basal-body rod protein FlgB
MLHVYKVVVVEQLRLNERILMINRLDEALRFQQTALSLRASRQELLASNIANADTPNYKAKDVDFASVLQNALAGTGAAIPVVQTSPMHLQGNAGRDIFGSPVMYRKPTQPSADGNTVDMDVERAQFADNALRYEASVKFVSDNLKEIMAAIQG